LKIHRFYKYLVYTVFVVCKILKPSYGVLRDTNRGLYQKTIRKSSKGLENSMILVTGGTGFIGQELVKRLLDSGMRVRVLSRREAETPGELFIGDITKPGSLTEAMRGVSEVYHLAALVDHFVTKEMLEKVNVTGTTNVAKVAIKQGVSRFVHCSTVSAERGGGTTAYGKSKILAEKALRSCGTGMSSVVIRPGPVYDGERRNLRKAVYLAMRFKIFGKIIPDNIIRLASRTNVVNGMLLAAE
jgi:nucleoside-diphosphate-sugar epimerase